MLCIQSKHKTNHSLRFSAFPPSETCADAQHCSRCAITFSYPQQNMALTCKMGCWVKDVRFVVHGCDTSSRSQSSFWYSSRCVINTSLWTPAIHVITSQGPPCRSVSPLLSRITPKAQSIATSAACTDHSHAAVSPHSCLVASPVYVTSHSAKGFELTPLLYFAHLQLLVLTLMHVFANIILLC